MIATGDNSSAMEESDYNPIAIILVSSGSRGDKLLYRYPYSEPQKKPTAEKDVQNPYAVRITEDQQQSEKAQSSQCSSNGHLVGFTDDMLATILATKVELCGEKFELKLNDIRFVGHPTLVHQASQGQGSPKREIPTMILFNVVFALKASACVSVIRCYHEFSKRIAIALRHEQKRCGYLSNQARIMLAVQDEIATLPEPDCYQSPFALLLNRSEVTRDLTKIFRELSFRGEVKVHINQWVEVSFCLPHKVHNMLNHHVNIQPEEVDKCLAALRPYHTFLLLGDENELIHCFSPDASPALVRVIRVATPLKSLSQIAADADITLRQVFCLVGHLVYWAKATIIYPLCETNVYVLSPNANLTVNSLLAEKFVEQFPGMSLHAVMEEFSLPSQLREHESPLGLPHQHAQKVQIVIWMLQRRLLVQLHTYVFLVPTSDTPTLLTDHSASSSTISPVSEDRRISTVSRLSDSDSIVSDMGSPSGSFVVSDNDMNLFQTIELLPSNSESDVQRHARDILPRQLTAEEKRSILSVPAASNPEDLCLFARLCLYFRGRHHLEEIMYRENLRRSQLITLIDKFRSVLLTCQHEDRVSAVFHNL